MSNTIVLASNNTGKLKEIRHYFSDLNYTIVSQADYNISSVEETGKTFIENALLKAHHVSQHSNQAILADDSGLIVNQLKGEPGLHSARYAGEPCSDANNNQKLLQALHHTPPKDRTAYFICVLVFLRFPSDPVPLISQGIWHGNILTQPQGKDGFGYDPLFFVPKYECTAAQLPLHVKNQISHRAQALHKMRQQLNTLE